MRRLAKACAALAAVACLAGGGAHAGKDNDTLVWATDREADVALPYYNNIRELVIISELVWDTLIFRDPHSFEYKPLLATGWEWIDDKTIDLDLRQGVRFHDGSDFGSEDVVATFNHVVADESGVLTRRNVDWIKTVEALGPYKVRIHLAKTFPAALEFLAMALPVFPSEIWQTARNDATGKPDWATIDEIGAGPYKIAEVVPGESITMVRNEDYWADSPKGRPEIGTVIFKTVPDAEAQVAQLLTGEIDWIWDVSKDKAADLAASGQVQVVNAKTFRVSYLTMDRAGRSGTDMAANPLYDKRVRQAIAHAIDRNAIAKQLVGEASEMIHSACHPAQFGCTQEVPQYEYDPEKAKALLAEAGFPRRLRDRPLRLSPAGIHRGGDGLPRQGRHPRQPQIHAIQDVARPGVGRHGGLPPHDLGLLLHGGLLRHHEPLLQARQGRLLPGRPNPGLAGHRRHQRRSESARRALQARAGPHPGGVVLAADVHLREILRLRQRGGLHADRRRDPALLSRALEIAG